MASPLPPPHPSKEEREKSSYMFQGESNPADDSAHSFGQSNWPAPTASSIPRSPSKPKTIKNSKEKHSHHASLSSPPFTFEPIITDKEVEEDMRSPTSPQASSTPTTPLTSPHSDTSTSSSSSFTFGSPHPSKGADDGTGHAKVPFIFGTHEWEFGDNTSTTQLSSSLSPPSSPPFLHSKRHKRKKDQAFPLSPIIPSASTHTVMPISSFPESAPASTTPQTLSEGVNAATPKTHPGTPPERPTGPKDGPILHPAPDTNNPSSSIPHPVPLTYAHTSSGPLHSSRPPHTNRPHSAPRTTPRALSPPPTLPTTTTAATTTTATTNTNTVRHASGPGTQPVLIPTTNHIRTSKPTQNTRPAAPSSRLPDGKDNNHNPSSPYSNTVFTRSSLRSFWQTLPKPQRAELLSAERAAASSRLQGLLCRDCRCPVCRRRRLLVREELTHMYDVYQMVLVEGVGTREARQADTTSHTVDSRPYEFDEDLSHTVGNELLDFVFGDPSDATVLYIGTPPSSSGTGKGKGRRDGVDAEAHGQSYALGEDIVRSEGQKFLEMMERLAERRMRREQKQDAYADDISDDELDEDDDGIIDEHDLDQYDEDEEDEEDEDEDEDEDDDANGRPGEDGHHLYADEYDTGGHSEDLDDEYADEYGSPYASEAASMHSDPPEDELTEEEQLEEGRRMFHIFAAKMFEQRVLVSYREVVAFERQRALIEEEEETQRKRGQRSQSKRDAQLKKRQENERKVDEEEKRKKKDVKKDRKRESKARRAQEQQEAPRAASPEPEADDGAAEEAEMLEAMLTANIQKKKNNSKTKKPDPPQMRKQTLPPAAISQADDKKKRQPKSTDWDASNLSQEKEGPSKEADEASSRKNAARATTNGKDHEGERRAPPTADKEDANSKGRQKKPDPPQTARPAVARGAVVPPKTQVLPVPLPLPLPLPLPAPTLNIKPQPQPSRSRGAKNQTPLVVPTPPVHVHVPLAHPVKLPMPAPYPQPPPRYPPLLYGTPTPVPIIAPSFRMQPPRLNVIKPQRPGNAPLAPASQPPLLSTIVPTAHIPLPVPSTVAAPFIPSAPISKSLPAPSAPKVASVPPSPSRVTEAPVLATPAVPVTSHVPSSALSQAAPDVFKPSPPAYPPKAPLSDTPPDLVRFDLLSLGQPFAPAPVEQSRYPPRPTNAPVYPRPPLEPQYYSIPKTDTSLDAEEEEDYGNMENLLYNILPREDDSGYLLEGAGEDYPKMSNGAGTSRLAVYAKAAPDFHMPVGSGNLSAGEELVYDGAEPGAFARSNLLWAGSHALPPSQPRPPHSHAPVHNPVQGHAYHGGWPSHAPYMHPGPAPMHGGQYGPMNTAGPMPPSMAMWPQQDSTGKMGGWPAMYAGNYAPYGQSGSHPDLARSYQQAYNNFHH